ncbi:uncharacterized protein LOC111445310 isoform X1 [Cucurbita moschata]|uniref:Uncharacterized protein LOC111445310 isoform X1 n=1 Tax=Cucurbita moschata TaxID=3662 RepID=A0A6J1FLG8_CUCMO|nr:uncharacterized protein LOC111445310 isoform X1 [Cucurbita moschata]XP_022939373.1 uncharacterized protein LOC111445310 isoform X1 [Cucurbita moschata]
MQLKRKNLDEELLFLRFPRPCKECFVPLSNQCGISHYTYKFLVRKFPSQVEQETTQYLESSGDAKDCAGGGDLESLCSPEEFSSSVDQLNQNFNKSLVLKSSSSRSSPIEVKDSSKLSMKQSEVTDKKETKRRYAAGMGTTGNENYAYLDLKLSPPGVYLRGKSSNESKSSSPKSQDSCVSAEVESNVNLENNLEVEGSPLIVMGCTFCLLYVMVTDDDPRCPICKNSGLLDIFRGNQPKRSRKN